MLLTRKSWEPTTHHLLENSETLSRATPPRNLPGAGHRKHDADPRRAAASACHPGPFALLGANSAQRRGWTRMLRFLWQGGEQRRLMQTRVARSVPEVSLCRDR